jgi:hypothetical protein
MKRFKECHLCTGQAFEISDEIFLLEYIAWNVSSLEAIV